jgi:hypothetical protein
VDLRVIEPTHALCGSEPLSEIDRSSTASARALRRENEAPGSAPETSQDASQDRPAASGHRFGPDLSCSECGVQWEAHQREPAPCRSDAPQDVFLRRPLLDEAGEASS